MIQDRIRKVNGREPDMMKTRTYRKKPTQDEKRTEFESYLRKLSRFATAPKTFRMPEMMVFRIERLARQLDTSAGRLMIELMYEILPQFEQGQTKVKFRTIEMYNENAAADALVDVDLERLFMEVRMASNFARRPEKEEEEEP